MQLAIRSTAVEEETGTPSVTSVQCESFSVDSSGTITALDGNDVVVFTAPGEDWDFVRANKPLD